MNVKAIKLFASAGSALTLLSVAPALAIPTPLGAQFFCIQNPDECRPGDVEEVDYSDTLLSVVASVNTSVNNSMQYRPDLDGIDQWSVGGRYGDCEDYALTKRAQLIRKGVPAGALRVAATKTKSGEPHAILLVRTDRGDLVLDNLSEHVMGRAQSGYRIERMATSNLAVWQPG